MKLISKIIKFAIGATIAVMLVLFVISFIQGDLGIDIGSSAQQTFEGLTSCASQTVQKAGQDVATDLANKALDESGVKQTLQSSLQEHAGDIASLTGASQDEVEAVIDDLAIEDWSVATLPDDAVATGSYDMDYYGAEATVTTYADDDYVTVETGGQTLTFAVPDTAEDYLSYLSQLN